MFILDLIVEALNQDDDDNGPAARRRSSPAPASPTTNSSASPSATSPSATTCVPGSSRPHPGQLHAVKAIICHVLAHHYRDVIAHRAGWTDPERQQPVGEPFHGLRPERRARLLLSPTRRRATTGLTPAGDDELMLDHDRHIDLQLWNTITLEGTLPDQLVRDVIEDPYDLVVSALPKRVRERLGWAPETDLPASLTRPGQALPLSAG